MSSSRSTQSSSSRPQLGLPKSALGATAEYRYRLQAVYQSPYRREQPCLHPQKENGALWIGIDDTVNNFIRKTWQNNFWGPWKNWTDVKKNQPDKIESWWGSFVANYYWDPSHEDLVFFEWKEKTKKGIGEEISRKHRKGVRPPYISNDDWVRLLAEWDTPKAKLRSEKAATSRQTPIDGSTMHVHYGGPNSFSKINYTLQQEDPQSRDHSLLDLVKKTHRRPDGTYSDPFIEGVVRSVEEEASPYEGTSSTAYSPGEETYTQRVNRLYLEKVNARYGEAYGVGSAKTQYYQPYSHYASSTQEAITRSEYDAFRTSTQTRLDRLEAGSSTGSGQNPNVQEDQSQGTLNPTAAPQGGIQLEEFNTTHLNSLGNFEFDM